MLLDTHAGSCSTSARAERLLFLAAAGLAVAVTVVAGGGRIPRAGESRALWDAFGAEPRWTAHLLLQELVLLGGAWLLARRWFRSPPAVFLTSVAVAGSALASCDVALNLSSICALPLLVFLLEEFAETGSRARLALAAVAAVPTALDLPPGLVPAPFVAVFCWFAARPSRDRRRELLPAGALLLLALAVAALRQAPSGPASGGDVLGFAGLRHPGRYLDLLVGAAPGLEFTSFCGFLTVGCAAIGLLRFPPSAGLRILAALLGSLLFLGLVLVALHAVFPALRPSRPVPVGGPWIRLVVAFLAGHGLDGLRRGMVPRPSLFRAAAALLAVAAGVAGLSAALILQHRAPEDALLALEGASPDAQAAWASDAGLLSDTLGASALFAALAGGAFLLAASARTLPFAFALILLVHPLDVFSWKARMTWLNTVPASAPRPPPEPPKAPPTWPVNLMLAVAVGAASLRGRPGP